MKDALNIKIFVLPAFILILLGLGLFKLPYVLPLAVLVGIAKIIFESGKKIRQGKWSLDYIAFAAMAISLYSEQYLAGAIIALMFAGGEALDEYASTKAETTLKSLSESIPKNCLVKKDGKFSETPIQNVNEAEIIFVKRGELIPLDGTLVSPAESLLDLANLTGESEPATVKIGTLIKSGAINLGSALELSVVGDFKSSTYHKIVDLVEQAKLQPPRTIRLSEKANLYFTVFTILIAGGAWFFTHDLVRLLSVLVIATPCPLIIAAPVAFVSGMSRAARSGIILRKPSAFEDISKAEIIFFDKTGTLTLGEPALTTIEIVEDTALTENQVLCLAAGLEIHSLHPLARTIVAEAKKRNLNFTVATEVNEKIGSGIGGNIENSTYTLAGLKTQEHEGGLALKLEKNEQEIARFYFKDILKSGTIKMLEELKTDGLDAIVITGDKKSNSEKVFEGFSLQIHAGQSPEDKYQKIEEAKAKGQTVIMVGDGINDAPALAHANVGIVFSGTENGASIEAADVAVLGSDVQKISELRSAAKKTLKIAKQSIWGGIALSVVGMSLAAIGLITPVRGALIQEVIDIVVILNALRALKS